MASGGDIHSILYRGDIFKQPTPKYDPTKNVQRYFPGQAPAYGKEESDEEEINDTFESVAVEPVLDRRLKLLESIESNEIDNSHIKKRRKREIIEMGNIIYKAPEENTMSEYAKESLSELPNISTKRREISEPQIIETNHIEPTGEINSISDSTQPVKISREERRERILAHRYEEEETLKSIVAPVYDDGVEEFDSTSDEDDSDDGVDQFRPIFIPASKRLLEKEQELKEEVEKKRLLDEEKKKQEQIEESKRIVAQSVLEEEEAEKKLKEDSYTGWDPENMPDDNDDENQELEYELWRTRELKRMLRQEEEKKKIELEAETIERRRQMSLEELEEDNKRLDKLKVQPETKRKYEYLQKYYHKGAFYQDLAATGAEPIYLRDFNEPLAEDKINKESLPTPMQLRRGQFGKSGRVKHTHLADVDSTDFTSNWSKRNPLFAQLQSHLAGRKHAYEFERPSKKKV